MFRNLINFQSIYKVLGQKGSSDRWLPSNPSQSPTSTISNSSTTMPPEKPSYLTDFEKGQIVALKENNLSFSEIGELLHHLKSTVQSFHNQYQKMGVAKNDSFTRRPTISNSTTCRCLVRESKKAHCLPLAELLNEVAPYASLNTNKRALVSST